MFARHHRKEYIIHSVNKFSIFFSSNFSLQWQQLSHVYTNKAFSLIHCWYIFQTKSLIRTDYQFSKSVFFFNFSVYNFILKNISSNISRQTVIDFQQLAQHLEQSNPDDGHAHRNFNIYISSESFQLLIPPLLQTALTLCCDKSCYLWHSVFIYLEILPTNPQCIGDLWHPCLNWDSFFLQMTTPLHVGRTVFARIKCFCGVRFS